MSLVVKASTSLLTTATSTKISDQDGSVDVHQPFVSPESPLAASSPPHSDHNYTPTKAADLLSLRFNHQRSPTVNSKSALQRSYSTDKELHSLGGCCDIDTSSPVKKAARRLAELDPCTIFDSNSRDSGFESEASRLSYSLSTASVNSVHSNPGTPASSSSGLSVGNGSVCLTNSNDDPLSGQSRPDSSKSSSHHHLCLWDACDDPDLSPEDEDNRKDLLGHVLSRHVQPLESIKINTWDDDQAMFKCLWQGCKVYGKGSKLYSWLENHVIERHSGPRPFVCPLPGCLQRFGSKLLAERHINSHFVDDDQQLKEKVPNVRMAPSNWPDKSPSRPSNSVPRRGEIAAKKPSSNNVQQQQVAANTRSSVKRKLEESQQTEEPAEKRAEQSSARKHSITNQRDRGAKNRSSVKQSSKLQEPFKKSTICTRRSGKTSVNIGTLASVGKAQPYDVDVQKPAAKKQCVQKVSSSQNNDIASKKATTAEFLEINTVRATTANAEFGSTSANGTGTVAKRKPVRMRHTPEDAFDAIHSRTVHVVAGKRLLSSMKHDDAGGSKRNSNSCHECSGINTDTSTSSGNSQRSKLAFRNCVCSNYITFHAKVLAKRSCGNGELASEGSRKSQFLCAWLPLGFLPQQWVDESAFRSTIRLSRSLFPALMASETSNGLEILSGV